MWHCHRQTAWVAAGEHHLTCWKYQEQKCTTTITKIGSQIKNEKMHISCVAGKHESDSKSIVQVKTENQFTCNGPSWLTIIVVMYQTWHWTWHHVFVGDFLSAIGILCWWFSCISLGVSVYPDCLARVASHAVRSNNTRHLPPVSAQLLRTACASAINWGHF